MTELGLEPEVIHSQPRRKTAEQPNLLIGAAIVSPTTCVNCDDHGWVLGQSITLIRFGRHNQ